jgi:hypothetical protein
MAPATDFLSKRRSAKLTPCRASEANSRHGKSISIPTRLEGIPAVGSFGPKAELLIKVYSSDIVRVDGQLNPPEP